MAGKKAAEEEPEPSAAAGGCVLFLLGCAPVAVVFAVSYVAGILTVWAVGMLLLWRAARRRVSNSSATPPPEGGRPTCHVCAGHSVADVTPLGTEKGMLIYKTSLPDRPGHTHIHLAPGEVNDS